jgi:hypothetical protein
MVLSVKEAGALPGADAARLSDQEISMSPNSRPATKEEEDAERKRRCPRCGTRSREAKPAAYTCANCGAVGHGCCFEWGGSRYCPPCAAAAADLGIQ